MSEAEICRLEAIELEEDDLDLFPDRVVEAYKSGPMGPRRAYGLLKSHVKREPNAQRKKRQQFWLERSRLWATEGKAPSQFTFNGIGTRLYGQREPNPADGSYIATLYLVFLFIPVIPLSSHWVSPGEGGGVWVHGSVPPPAGVWKPTFLIWGLGAAAFALLIGSLVSAGSSTKVIVHNGFDTPVHVAAGDDGTTVQPHGYETLWLPADEDLEAEARFVGSDAPFETVVLPLATEAAGFGSNDDLVYNVAGRSLLVVESIIYGPGTPDEPVVLTDKVSAVDDLDYLFTDPPEEIRTDRSSEMRTVLAAVAPEEPRIAILGFLMSEGEPESMLLAMATSELIAGSDDPYVIGMVAAFRYGGQPVGPEFCEELIAQVPDSVERHRWCQSREAAVDREETVAKYRQLAEANPDSAMHWYLLGRLLPGDEGLETQRRALSVDPDYPRAHFAIAWTHLVEDRDPQVGLTHVQAALAGDPVIDGGLELEARLRQALGQSPAEIAGQLKGRDQETYALADSYALVADPTLYDGFLQRAEGSSEEPLDVANSKANLALIAGKLDDLRRFNAAGAGLEVFQALDQDATDSDRAWALPSDPWPNMDSRSSLLHWLHGRLTKQQTEGWEAPFEAEVPGLAALLSDPDSIELPALRQVVAEARPATQAAALYAAWRLTGDAEYARRAHRLALPGELPGFALP